MKNSQSSAAHSEHSLQIHWLYPGLMSTYGDRGNIIVLAKRCEWRNINTEVIKLNEGFVVKKLEELDILFMGGAEDVQQQIVARDFRAEKIKALKSKIEDGTPGLYICGALQFLGKFYKDADGTEIKGLGIFDLYTEHPGEGSKRLIGNIAVKTNLAGLRHATYETGKDIVIGFENHGGRTRLGKDLKPFAQVVKGFGNNGEDKTEGAIYKNSIGTYLHGPILPKNPEIADWLIEKALEKKYKKKINLEKLDDLLSQKAKESILSKIT